MSLDQIRFESRSEFLKTGRFKTYFSVTRQEFLDLINDLRENRVFFSIKEALTDMNESPAMAVMFKDGVDFYIDSRGGEAS